MKTTLHKKLLPIILLLITHGVWAQPFNNKLPIPSLLTGSTFNISVATGTYNFYPFQKAVTGKGADTLNFNQAIPTMGYNGAGYLGPTMVWQSGQPVTLNQTNNLNMRTTIHWHGLNLPAHLDGGPQEPINANGGVFNANFKVIDSVQTVWYHAHLMDSTTYQVIKGLSGMILVEKPGDPNRAFLPHSYDTNDFPIIIQDKGFVFGPRYSVSGTDSARRVIALDTAGGGSIKTPGNGAYTLINGALNGYLKVPKGMVRLRFLNGSYRKTFQLAVGNKASNPNAFEKMYLIATDGGYVAAPTAMDSIIIGPGERYEFLVDFSGKGHKDTVYLSNRSGSLPTAGGNPNPGTNVGYVTGGFNGAYGKTAFMSFIVDTGLPGTPILTKPATLTNYTIDTSSVFRHRLKVLGNDSVTGGKFPGVWTINGDTMNMDLINDTILVGAKEIWSIKNTTNVYHPFHIHKIQFQVLDIRDTLGNVQQSFYNGTLPKNMVGYKDDVLVPPYSILRFVGTFHSYGSKMFDVMEAFMYHCHILTHEDNAMMQQFIVLDSALYYSITGTGKPKQMGSFLMYPNPASSTLNLKGESKEDGTMRITDVLGRTLREEKVAAFNGTTSINVADLPRGVVFVEWTSGNGRYVQKVFLN